MKCPRCDEYMEKKGDSWYCSDCGYSWSEHSLFPVILVTVTLLITFYLTTL